MEELIQMKNELKQQCYETPLTTGMLNIIEKAEKNLKQMKP